MKQALGLQGGLAISAAPCPGTSMAVSTQHCTSMVGRAAVQQQYYLQASDPCSAAAAAAKMLATLTVGECSARRGQILPRDGGEQQHQQQHSAVTGSSSARGLQYFCEQQSWSVGRSVAFFSFFSPEPSGKPAGPNSHTRRTASLNPLSLWDAPPYRAANVS